MKIKKILLTITGLLSVLLFSTKANARDVLPDYIKDESGVWQHINTTNSSVNVISSDSIFSVTYRLRSNFEKDLKTYSNNLQKNYHFADTDSKDNSAVLMFTGDLMCLAGQQFSAESKGSFDFSASYSLVAPIFNSADLVCGNLETLISSSSPLTKVMKNIGSTPQCNGPEEYLRTLRNAGFDYFATANNHCCDWGSIGITETCSSLDKYGFAHSGTASQIGDNFAIFDVNGIKVALLSYTHIVNQRGKLTNDQMNNMVSLYSEERVASDIKLVRSKGADFVAVYCHWGIENTETLTEYQKKDALYIANAGADLILGSHPHCLQGKSILHTDDDRKVPCMYSMGNFVSSMVRDINNDTIILQVRINKVAKDNSVKIEDIDYIPCHVMPKDGKSFCVVPTSPKLNGGMVSSTLDAAEKRIRKIIGDFDEY